MLFTRCPECDTTFRVTDETLKKANGQVRCGRCASVFNAYAELHDPAAKSFEPEPPTRGTAESRPAAAAPTASTGRAPSGDAAHIPPPAAAPKPADPTAINIDATSVADVVAEAEVAARDAGRDARGGATQARAGMPEVEQRREQLPEAVADASAPGQEAGAPQPDVQPITATEVERVLTAVVAAPLPAAAYVWSDADASPPENRSGLWSAAAALALIALGVQTLHHFRSDVAGHATFGPWLAVAYRALGAELTPNWDVQQYEIIDWVATAEPNARGLGSLRITARIKNHGPQQQPYPAVQLRLKDRWEEAVGSRTFTPAEYLPRDTPRGRLMSPGETARAELEVVDPGPDAYGFELDVCIEVEASLVSCRADEVFSDARAAR